MAFILSVSQRRTFDAVDYSRPLSQSRSTSGSSSSTRAFSSSGQNAPRTLFPTGDAQIRSHIVDATNTCGQSSDEDASPRHVLDPHTQWCPKPKSMRHAATISDSTSPLHQTRHHHSHSSAVVYSHMHSTSSLRPPKKLSKSHGRNKSTSSMSLKRLSKALPSFNFPSFTLPIFTSPFDFSAKKSTGEMSPTGSTSGSTDNLGAKKRRSLPPVLGTGESSLTASPTCTERPALDRTTTEDSLLFTPIERMSSLGDDARWVDIREQVNVRGQAIRESLPEIKVPRLSVFRNSIDNSIDSPTSPHFALPSAGVSSLSFGATFPETALDRILDQLEGDVVILGGYRGSILRSADTRQQVWAPVKLGLGMRTPDLFVGLNPEDELGMEERIIPDGMLQHVGPVDVSRRLYRKLCNSEAGRSGRLRVHDYGYDWRLSPHLLSQKLTSFLESLPSNKHSMFPDKKGAIVIAHSLGGIITRHAVNARPDLFSGVVYAGVPQRCVNILGPLRFGDPVLFNHDILTSRVNFSFRTSFVFLPEDGKCFVNRETGEEYPVDFYDVDDWIRYRLCPEVSGPPLPRPFETRSDTITAKMKRHGSLVAKRTRAFTFSPGQALSSLSNSAQNTVQNTEQSIEQQATNSAQLSSIIPGTKRANQVVAPLDEATLATNRAYLARTLAEIKLFRSELAHDDKKTARNEYPPMSVIFAKNTPTLAGARIPGPEAIPRADAYDSFLFQSGDGVVLARQAMLPEGYCVVSGGLVEVQRGHLTLLGDFEAVGRALEAIIKGRRRGIGVEGKTLPANKVGA